jgi:threonine dehydrogenase-like Zn-dependent dehydrogenase
MEARAAVQVGDREIELWTLPVPDELGADEALLQIEGSGMCGSDWDQYRGELIPCYPVIDGHEIVGRIAKIGPVASARMGVGEGDRVAVEGWRACGTCIQCQSGLWKHCPDGMVYGLTSVDDKPGLNGGYSEYLVMRSNSGVYRMDPSISVQDAVFFNPLGSGLDWGVRLAGTQLGDTVLIAGPGQRGLGCVIGAREAGAANIIVAGRGLRPWKLELALELGATHVINTDEDDMADVVRHITGGAMADRAIDTTPHVVKPLYDCIASLRGEGTLVITSHKDDAGELSNLIMRNALTVKGAKTASPWGKQQAIRILGMRKYDLSAVHTHTFPIHELDTAMRVLGGEVPGEEAIHITVTPH